MVSFSVGQGGYRAGRAFLRALLCWLCLEALCAAQAVAETPPPILPLTAVRPGMTGYGLTVFQGTKPERFVVRVIGVLRQHLPQMDIIIVESDDRRLMHSGIAAGMSGSPIYIEGKLVGALAYGWLFAKDAVGGVTPIEYMLKDLRRAPIVASQEPAPATPFVADLPNRRTLQALLGDRQEAARPTVLEPFLPPRPPSALAEARLTRVALPLSVAGLSEQAIERLRQTLSPFGLVPQQAGGGSQSPQRGLERSGFEPGGALAVELMRGDLHAAGTGTVTYIEGSRVAAFGHQMLNAGEVRFPIATAEIITILASQMSSFKMSAPLFEQGSLVLDRQAGVIGDTKQKATVIPMQVSLGIHKSGSLASQDFAAPTSQQKFHVELANHRFLTPALAQSVVQSALQASVPDITDAVVSIQSQLAVKGYPPLIQTDYFYSAAGVTEKLVNGATGMKQLADLLTNPFSPVVIEGLDLRIDVSYRADVAEITGIAVPGDELEPDTRPALQVTLRPYGGTPYVRAIPIEVPRGLGGQSLKIEASAGPLVKPEVAAPESLPDLVANLRKGYAARSLVVTLSTLDEGMTLRGQLLPNLPASVIATLRPSGASKRGEVYKRVSRFVTDMGTVLSGKQELTVLLRDDK